MAHNALNGGAVTEIGGGKAMLNATVHQIDSGKALFGGTVYPITFAEKCIVTLLTFFRYNSTPDSADQAPDGPSGIGIVLKDTSGNVRSADMYEGISGMAVLPSAYSTWSRHTVGTQVCSQNNTPKKSTFTIDACVGDTFELWIEITGDGDNKPGYADVYLNGTQVLNDAGGTDTNKDGSFTGDERFVSYSTVVTGNATVDQTDSNGSTGGPMVTIKITMEG